MISEDPHVAHIFDVPRAVLELVENALDAGAENIRVRVADGDTVTAVVGDDGRGMTEDEIEKALRGGYSTKPTPGGRGICMCRTAAVAAGGSLEIESGGCGTVVTVCAPRANATTDNIADAVFAISCGRAGTRVTLTRESMCGGYSISFDTGASAHDALRLEDVVRKHELDLTRK